MTNGSSSDPLRVDQRLEGPVPVLRAIGEIDINTAAVLAEELDLAISEATPPGPIVADLSDVTFLGSAGLAVLLDARARCELAGLLLRLVATGHPVLRSLEIAGVQDLLPVYSTVAEAVVTGE